MKRGAALGAALGCAVAGTTVRAQAAPPEQPRAQPAATAPAARSRPRSATPASRNGSHLHAIPPGRTELGLRLGAARPLCDCSPHFGPALRLHVLGAMSRAFKLGVSAGYARFSYVDTSVPSRATATTTTLRLLMRAYPVMGRRVGLYFDLGVGWAHATMSGDYSSDSPTLGIGAGIPIVIVRWLRLAPYVSGLFHAAGPEACGGLGSASTSSSSCSTRPGHSGFLGLGLEATVLLGH